MEEHTDEVGGRGIKSQDGEISLRNEYEHLKKTMLHTNIFAMEQREFIVQRLFLLCGRRQAFLCEVGRWGHRETGWITAYRTFKRKPTQGIQKRDLYGIVLWN